MDENDKCSVIQNLNTGSGLAATQDIPAGSLILQIHSPFILVLETPKIDRFCSYCFLPFQDGPRKRCTACKVVRYCSTECQRADWKLIHQKECPVLKEVLPPTPVRALIQVLLVHSSGSSQDSRWQALQAHVEEFGADKQGWEDLRLQAMFAVKYSKTPTAQYDLAIQILCRMKINAFSATLGDDERVGLCFEPKIALANHSCCPNATVVFNGRTVSLRALDTIRSSEQIFISYIDPTQSTDERQTQLRKRYFFSCQCLKCRGSHTARGETPYHTFRRYVSEGHYVGSPPRMKVLCNLDNVISMATECINNLDSDSSLEAEFSKAKKIFDDEQSDDPNSRIKSLKTAFRNDRFPAHPPYPAILHEIYLNCLDRQEPTSYIQALILLLFLFFNSDIYNYPQPQHPVRVVRLYAIAKLLQLMIKMDEWDMILRKFSPGTRDALRAINFLDASYTTLILVVSAVPNSHGPGRFMDEVENELKEVYSLYGALNRKEPKDLKAWLLDEKHVEGEREARSIVAKLQNLGGCYRDILASIA